ncbi:hypothetical protein ACWDUX_30380 [Streptomyces sp. NPDC003444]
MRSYYRAKRYGRALQGKPPSFSFGRGGGLGRIINHIINALS